MNNPFSRFCCRLIFLLAFLFMTSMFIGSLFLTVNVNATQEASEVVTFSTPSIIISLAGLLIFFLLHKGMLRLLKKISLSKGIVIFLGLWGLCAAGFIIATNLSQLYDYQYVLEIGQLFSKSRFSSLHSDYISAYPFQLGICLFIELISRCMPSSVDIGLFLQLLNVLACLVSSGALCAICFIVWNTDALCSCVFLCCTSLPLLMYCIYVYGTLYMMSVLLLIFLFFILYQKTLKNRYLILCSLLFPVAYAFKLNAAVALIAFAICCLLLTLEQKQFLPILSAFTAILLTLLISYVIPWQYELRSGYTIQSTVSTKARFIMGFQNTGPAFGWHNRYIEKYFPLELTKEERLTMEDEDFHLLINELRASPSRTIFHLIEKIETQWLEPSYETIRYLQVCEAKGPYPFISKLISDTTTPFSRFIQLLLKLDQQLIYLTSAVCIFSILKSRNSILLIFALTIGGGILYHFLFEAKSAYALIYLIFDMVFASEGIMIIDRKSIQLFSQISKISTK